jgi:hypothetical protein
MAAETAVSFVRELTSTASLRQGDAYLAAIITKASVYHVCMIASVVVALCATGCGDSDVMKRRDQSISLFRTAQPDSLLDPVKVLSQLKIATPQTLAQPMLCQSSMCWKTTEQNKLLLVSYWIENQPTVNAVRLERKEEYVDCPILSMYALENAKEAKVGVVFTSVLHFPEDSEKAFTFLDSEDMPSVVLLRDGKPISNRLTVQRIPDAKETSLREDR